MPPREAGASARPCGVVETFDVDAGLGTVVADDGAVYGFHCTEIADGTRSIEIGVSVTFEVGPAGPGVWEAKAVSPSGV